MNDEEVMTVAEVAKALRVSPMSVYRLIDSGQLKSLRVGRSIRILRGALTEILESGK